MPSSKHRLPSGLDELQCVEELSWNAEEMSFVRVLGERLEVAAMYPESPAQILASICEPLRRAVHAEAMFYVPTGAGESSDGKHVAVWAGPKLLDDEQGRQLAAARVRQIVDNQLQADMTFKSTAARSAVVISTGTVDVTSGYLVGLNSCHPDGFGTREAGLLRTVSAFLTVYIKGYCDASAPF